MRKYSEPEIEIREYTLANDKVFTSDPATGEGQGNLNNDDEYDMFGNN